jgi:hypothetical protein
MDAIRTFESRLKTSLAEQLFDQLLQVSLILEWHFRPHRFS